VLLARDREAEALCENEARPVSAPAPCLRKRRDSRAWPCGCSSYSAGMRSVPWRHPLAEQRRVARRVLAAAHVRASRTPCGPGRTLGCPADFVTRFRRRPPR